MQVALLCRNLGSPYRPQSGDKVYTRQGQMEGLDTLAGTKASAYGGTRGEDRVELTGSCT